MNVWNGKSVYSGIAMGPVVVLKKEDNLVKCEKIADAEAEIARVKAAVEVSKMQLQELYEKALGEVGETGAMIFQVHQMMLEDEEYLGAVHSMIRSEMVNAEYAVSMTGDGLAEMFAGIDDDYMRARAADVKDISHRLICSLTGYEGVDLIGMEPSVIIAEDLTPSETVQMDKSKILAFVTVHGSTNSHTAILARMMNIPALVGVPLDMDVIENGMAAIVDGFNGTLTLEPTEEIWKNAEAKKREENEKNHLSWN